MGRAPCCSKVGLHRGAWSDEEDKLLTNYIQTHGEGQWRSMPSKAERAVEIVPDQPASSTSSLSLRKSTSFDNGASSGESSSCTFEADPVTTDFRWPELFDMEGASSVDGLNMDGFDLLMLKDDESEMLEKLYDECWLLLQDGDGDGDAIM
ncbi:Homeodomain-like protein [Cynara cardunculus var. scolymus]|uniref:Homeodomain-like protein n=1 Tax=Cynara cardunculus var. scolymus TaxID=59895 RepID=A0A103XR24_CYNCS|nr:Homeodomain-like protein [Cynara cardunculus var. scolymus]